MYTYNIFKSLYDHKLYSDKNYNLKLKKSYLLKDSESGIVYTNNRILDSEIRQFKSIGVDKNIKYKHNKKLIVSLTSFPQRMKDVKYTLYSLLTQIMKPNKIILWLASSQFPNKENDIPKEVLNFKNNGLIIKWYDKDIRSYKKIIPAFEEYPEDIIVTADDDIFYLRNWLERLYEAYLKYNCIITCCGYKFDTYLNEQTNYFAQRYAREGIQNGIQNFVLPLTGFGTLYPTIALYKDCIKSDLFMKLCQTSDDIWFFIMNVLQHNKTVVIGMPNNTYNCKSFIATNLLRDLNKTNDFRLCKDNSYYGDKNNQNLHAVLSYYKSELLKMFGGDNAI